MSRVRRYRKNPHRLVEKLDALIERRDEYAGSDLVFWMLESVFKLVGDGASRGDLKMLDHALMELRYAFRVFAPYRGIRKVSIFGSARTKGGDVEYRLAEKLAKKVTTLGYMVITGAGPGIMEAAQGGAGRAKSFGVNIRLPFESEANEFIQNDSKLVHFKYFFTRKVVFLKETDAVVIFPGGFGTHDEAFESLTLVQTGKGEVVPIVFVDRPGGTYWKDWRCYIEKHLAKSGCIDEADMSLFKVTDDIDEAVEEVDRFYANFHSTRWIAPRLVLRLEREVSDEILARLNDDFADIVVSGTIERLAGLARAEEDEPFSRHLHRVAFRFDRKSNGRLRQMIDLLNREG